MGIFNNYLNKDKITRGNKMKQLQKNSNNQQFEFISTPRKRPVMRQMRQDRQDQRTAKKNLRSSKNNGSDSASSLDETKETIELSNEIKWVKYKEDDSFQKYKRDRNTRKKHFRIKKAKKNEFSSNHIEVYQKLLICGLFSLISVFLFDKPKQSFSIVSEIKGSQKNVFEITTNRLNESFLINYENDEEILFWLKSKKTARVRVDAQITMGYKIITANSKQLDEESEHIEIQFSDLMVLDCNIEIKQYLDVQDGYFNQWQLSDNHMILSDIKKKYTHQIEKKAFQLVQTQQRLGLRLLAENQLYSILNRYEVWFQVLLRKLDLYFENVISGFSHFPNRTIPQKKELDLKN